jgi:hypothetical protein
VTKTRKTKAAYEEYLNEALQGQPHPQGGARPPEKPGTWLRRNDPIQFEVGYNEHNLGH